MIKKVIILLLFASVALFLFLLEKENNTVIEEIDTIKEKEFLNDYSLLQIGDFYYNDGTFSHKRNEEKECVGIVFTLHVTPEEQKHGWTHGQIVALEDAGYGEQYEWGYKNTKYVWDIEKVCLVDTIPDLQIKEYDTYAMAKYDYDGYLYTYSSYLNQGEFIAFDIARNYSVPLPMGKASGWYLPSIGQWIDILQYLGKVHIKEGGRYGNFYQPEDVRLSSRPMEGTYWSSTTFGRNQGWYVNFSSTIGGIYADYRRTKMRVRPVAAF